MNMGPGRVCFGRIISFLLIVFSTVLPAQDHNGSPDMYTRINQITDSLQHWREHPPESGDTDTLITDFHAVFDGYKINIDTIADHTFEMVAVLPEYLDELTTSVKYRIKQDTIPNKVEYIAEFQMSDSLLIYDDSSGLSLKNLDTLNQTVQNLLFQRFHYYRSLSLPAPYRMKSFYPDSVQPILLIHGRNVDTLQYGNFSSWAQTLRYLSHHMLVYAGPLSIRSLDSMRIELQFYIAMTKPNARGHHFMVINEIIRDSGINTLVSKYRIDFYPFVRTDNLLSLFKPSNQTMPNKKTPISIGDD